MSTNRSIRDTLISQTKELGFQLTLGKEIRKSVNTISDTELELETSIESEVGSKKEELDLKKKLEKLLKNQRSLALNKKILEDSKTKLGSEIVDNLELQEIDNQKLVKSTKERLKFTQKIRSNLAVGFFGGLSELTQQIAGASSQLSIAFEEAEKAARQVVVDSYRTSQQESEQIQRLKEIKSHIGSGGKFTKAEAKKWGLLSSNGKLLTGSAAKEHAKKITLLSSEIESNSNPFQKFFKSVPSSKSSSPAVMGKAFAKGFKTFAKALPGIAVAAIAVQGVALAVKGIKKIVSLLEGASKMSAELSNSLLLSREASRDLMHDISGIVNQYNDLALSEGRMTVLRKDMVDGNKLLNEELGLSMNFMTGMGDTMSENTIEAGKMKNYLGFTDSTIARMTMDAQKSGKSLRQFTDDALFDIADTSRGAGVARNFRGLMDEAASLTGRQRAAMGGEVDVIAKNMVKMKAFGGNLGALEGAGATLTNIEDSISKEMQVYAITGVHLDLSKLRFYAETNRLGDYHREMNKQLSLIGGLEQYNLADQELIISAFGISLDDYYQMKADAAEASALAAKQQTLDEFLESNELASEIMNIEHLDFNDVDIKEKMKQLDVGKQIEMMREKGTDEVEIRKIISAQIRESLETESAQQRATKAWNRATEILVDKMGNGEWFDMFTDMLAGFAFYTVPTMIGFLSSAENFVNTSLDIASGFKEFFGGDPIENRMKFTSLSDEEVKKMNEEAEAYRAYRDGVSVDGENIGFHSPTEALSRITMMPQLQEQLLSVEAHYAEQSSTYTTEVFSTPKAEAMAASEENLSDENMLFSALVNTKTEGLRNLANVKSLGEFDITTDLSSLTYEELTELGPSYFENKKQEISTFTAGAIEENKPLVSSQISSAVQEYTSSTPETKEIAESDAQNTRDEREVVTAAPIINTLLNEGGLLGGIEGAYASTNVVSGLQGDVISFPGEEPIRLPAGSLNLSTLGGIAGNMTNQSNLTANSKNMLGAALENLLNANDLVIEGTSVGQVS